MSEPDQRNASGKPAKIGSQDPFHASEEIPAGEQIIVKKAAKKSSGLLIVLLGAVAILGVVAITLTQKPSFMPKASSDSDDLGAGIANASGIRGHLVTRWQGKTQYMLKIEPIDPRSAAGFSAVTENPPKAITINIRLLDAGGFALCGKEILLPFDPSRASRTLAQLPKNPADAQRVQAERQARLQQVAQQERTRESSKDVFENIQGHDGSVEALWAQGELPCSPDQYKKFDYWDISTNFPTIAEQDVLLGHRPAVAGHQVASNDSDQPETRSKRKPAVKAAVSTFYVEGDDQISMYEPGRALLTGDSGHSFFIPVKTDQTIAAAWAANYSHIHFRCDQHANCALRTGSGAILGRMGD